jgi:DNA-binding response OmpR family regulator
MGARRAPELRLGEEGTCLEFGDVRVDTRDGVVHRGGRPVALGRTKHRLLCYFLERPGQTLSRGELLVRVLGYNRTIASRTIDVHVAGLRRKLGRSPDSPLRLLSVYGRGYRLVVNQSGRGRLGGEAGNTYTILPICRGP